MDTVTITKAPTGGAIQTIPSKSAANRLLIAGFLSGIDTGAFCKGLSDDIAATKRCLAELDAFRAGPACGVCQLDCGESASTLRFLMPLVAVLGIESDFICSGRLADRPMEPLLTSLAAHGCTVIGQNPKHLSGRLSAGTFTLPGSISSQFITGLLLALPLLEGESNVVVLGRLQSRPYVDLTLQVLDVAGVQIQERSGADRTVFTIPGGQAYALPESALTQIEGDWSSAAFWIVMDAMQRLHDPEPAGRITPRIFVEGLRTDSVQGDKAIVEIADKMLAAEADQTETMGIDAVDTPDLVPALTVLACARPAGSVTNIVNAERLRFKESDRLDAITKVLMGLGADISQSRDALTIRSRGRLDGGVADSFGDHRIAMMAAAAACIAANPITITGASAVQKSYPHFYEDYQKLGGTLQWL